MFPLHDIRKTERTPIITRFLIALNILVFCGQWSASLMGDPNHMVREWGVQPRCYAAPGACGIMLPDGAGNLLKPLVTSLFLHGGFLHLAFNMLFLWVFGPGVEDRMGRLRFPLFYLGCGVLATLAHIFTHPASPVFVIGASGAIAGVLGAYFIFLPRSWILTYIPPIYLLPVPAALFLGLWCAGQIGGTIAHWHWFFADSPGGAKGGDIAWMAHIGGFAAGALVAWSIKPWGKRRQPGTGQ